MSVIKTAVLMEKCVVLMFLNVLLMYQMCHWKARLRLPVRYN